MTARFRVRAAVAVLAVAGALAACGSSGGGAGPTGGATPPSGSAPASATGSTSGGPAPAAGRYYVSVGDSYAAGYQPTGTGRGHTTRNGFAYQTVGLAAQRGYRLDLVNFGCSGATTSSLLKHQGCGAELLGPGATPYSGTQAAAAEAFLRAHRGQVALVTVSIGGNDITACQSAANPVSCVATAVGEVRANLATLLTGLRSAGGSSVRIVGLTYPDVLLGGYLQPSTRTLAELSVTAFKALINPGLQATYKAAGATFVDVTSATGAYGPLTATTTLSPYGRIPVPVAKVCSLTYFCQYRDIHPRTDGYALIAKLVAEQLPQR